MINILALHAIHLRYHMRFFPTNRLGNRIKCSWNRTKSIEKIGKFLFQLPKFLIKGGESTCFP